MNGGSIPSMPSMVPPRLRPPPPNPNAMPSQNWVPGPGMLQQPVASGAAGPGMPPQGLMGAAGQCGGLGFPPSSASLGSQTLQRPNFAPLNRPSLQGGGMDQWGPPQQFGQPNSSAGSCGGCGGCAGLAPLGQFSALLQGGLAPPQSKSAPTGPLPVVQPNMGSFPSVMPQVIPPVGAGQMGGQMGGPPPPPPPSFGGQVPPPPPHNPPPPPPDEGPNFENIPDHILFPGLRLGEFAAQQSAASSAALNSTVAAAAAAAARMQAAAEREAAGGQAAPSPRSSAQAPPASPPASEPLAEDDVPERPIKRRRRAGEVEYEVAEALKLQRQLRDGFATTIFQERLKDLQRKFPERKTKGHSDGLAYFEAFESMALSVYAKVLPDWGLGADWDGVREMLLRMAEAMRHPKVKRLQEEINVYMGLPRDASFNPPPKTEIFVYRPEADAPILGPTRPYLRDEDGDEAHEFYVEDADGELRQRGPTAMDMEESWFQVTHSPAVVIREKPDEKSKMVGRKKVGKRIRVQRVLADKWLQLHHSELVKLGVQEAWVLLDGAEMGLAGQKLLTRVG